MLSAEKPFLNRFGRVRMHPLMAGVAEMQQVVWLMVSALGASENMMDGFARACADREAGFASSLASLGDLFAGLDEPSIGLDPPLHGGPFDGFLGALDRRPF